MRGGETGLPIPRCNDGTFEVKYGHLGEFRASTGGLLRALMYTKERSSSKNPNIQLGLNIF